MGINAQIEADFLAANAKVDGVQETASGLQYKVLHQGQSDDKPNPKSMVNVHYHGTLIDGTVLDSSVERKAPISFGLHQVIKGWTEGLQLMSPGDKYLLYVPHQLAYGEKRVGSIPPASLLIFEVEVNWLLSRNIILSNNYLSPAFIKWGFLLLASL